jgi:hypothetical protein
MSAPERPPLAKPLSFEDVGRLEEFRGMSRDQVRHHLLRVDEEVGGRMLLKQVATDGKTHYRVTLASLKAFLPSLFPKEERGARDLELEARVCALEEVVERQAGKIGALVRRVEGLEGRH